MSTLPATMQRVGKAEGVGAIVVESVPVPAPTSRQVLVRTYRSLISRGSEIGGRYRKREAIRPEMMGYSAAGEIVAVGDAVDEVAIGDRVAVVAPHAEYVLGDVDAIGAMAITRIPAGVSYDQAVFHPLSVGAVLWTEIAEIRPDETVVVMGQGLVGNLVLQAASAHAPRRLIAVDAIEARCDLAARFGADAVIDVRHVDPVERVRELTGGEGAHLVMECVGGPAGVRSFGQAVEMTRPMGRIHLIGLYQEQPLPLDGSAIQRRKIIGGYYTDLNATWRPAADEAMTRLASGHLRVEPLITHRFPPSRAAEAFALLHDRPDEALGVIFTWDP